MAPLYIYEGRGSISRHEQHLKLHKKHSQDVVLPSLVEVLGLVEFRYESVGYFNDANKSKSVRILL